MGMEIISLLVALNFATASIYLRGDHHPLLTKHFRVRKKILPVNILHIILISLTVAPIFVMYVIGAVIKVISNILNYEVYKP